MDSPLCREHWDSPDSAPGTGPNALYRLTYLICLLALGDKYAIISILQVRKLGDREVKQLAQGHTTHKI